MRPCATICARVSVVMACCNDMWIVTGTTRKPPPTSIITGVEPGPARSARYSVWPGWRKPES